MERKTLMIWIGIVCVALLIAAGVFFANRKEVIPGEMLLKIKDAEISLENEGIKNTAELSQKYDSAKLDYYYKYDYCLELAKEVLAGFEGKLEIAPQKIGKLESSLSKMYSDGLDAPSIAVISGNAKVYGDAGRDSSQNEKFTTIIQGIPSCSEKILLQELCNIVSNPPKTCDGYAKEKDSGNSLQQGYSCYKPCNVKRYDENGNSVYSLWDGPPCGMIDEYVEGESKEIGRKCYGDSCGSDETDAGCCREGQCANDGKCYPLNSKIDVGQDGKIEVCSSINEESMWINPDINKETCSDSELIWFSCIGKDECEYGINNYDRKSKELCCGDDKGEYATNCKGNICKDSNDYACCDIGQCTYKGKCYDAGCNKVKAENGQTISMFCNGDKSSWVDLDGDRCAECMGKSAWSGAICCGDDAGEGEYVTRFVINDKNSTNRVAYYQCTNKKTECVYPDSDKPFEEGLYVFNEGSTFMKGAYYCSSAEWYGLDANEKYCNENGYTYDKKEEICCGDDSSEYYLKGKDGSYACCNTPNDDVADGECINSGLCGNNKINNGEACEDPETKNNKYCLQQKSECIGSRLGIRDSYGDCSSQCLCSNDNDCQEGDICDQNSCGCKPKAFCGDGIIQQINSYGQKEKCEPSVDGGCKVDECRGKKSVKSLDQVKSVLSQCGTNCKCDYGVIAYGCAKNSCGAECSEDGSGCEAGKTCNTETCGCIDAPSACGNGICEIGEEDYCKSDCSKECPYGIDLEFNRESYYLNDTITATVSVYNKDRKLIPDARFSFDVMVNGVIVGSSQYSMPSEGPYVIQKEVTNLAPKGQHRYIVKSDDVGCQPVSDSKNVYVYVNNRYTIPPQTINFSRFEFIISSFNFTNEGISQQPKCGNEKVEYGEACEGRSVCRPSTGCDYANKVYDYDESCSGCDCSVDKKSGPSDADYCSSCKSCGDGIVNCGEECENGTKSLGRVCKDGKIYEQTEKCKSCKWVSNETENTVLVESCQCSCPKNPQANCINGDYINYTKSYNSGCSGNSCGQCNCADNYAKDTDSNGIEDKCDPEICGNGKDENDNGKTDEEPCVWKYCSQCGYGIFNLCRRSECGKFEEGCFFTKNNPSLLGNSPDGIGACSKCSSVKGCGDYRYDNVTCAEDPCMIGKCKFSSGVCCTDSDEDGVCDTKDNCIDVKNSGQEDTDRDGAGNECDKCSNEEKLYVKEGDTETKCSDGIDNDCDGKADCADEDCAGILGCCQTEKDCVQSKCAAEACSNNGCVYTKRPMCDAAECPQGSSCDSDGKCKTPEESFGQCVYCAKDKTPSDYGLGYGNFFGSAGKSACCGNDDNEYYIVQKDTFQSGCCSAADSCVDYDGKCQASGTPEYEGHSMHCFKNSWNECSNGKHELCSDASGNTGWKCTFNGLSFGWRSAMPNEVCNDAVDNDCDGKIDSIDEDCKLKNE